MNAVLRGMLSQVILQAFASYAFTHVLVGGDHFDLTM
jgi:hypothetical protein